MKALSTKEQMDFLTALKLGNSVTKACEKAHISRRRVYYFKAEDPEFDECWKDAIDAATDELEDHLRSRALDPDDKSGHLLLMFLLKKINPQYRENYKTETKKAVAATQEFEFSEKEVDQALAILNRSKEVSKASSDKATSLQGDKTLSQPQDDAPAQPDPKV